ncbi:BTAD domain-containing putative transcriptional regulator [Amycolatopsis sp. cmx-11-12]|uniref:AfsR/SARP family transcriptional regulator n=1 Tax=Amycolatopsis sp. cmx-11-12 TaxID=2785795 RepID=UPI00391717C5
MNHLNDHTLAPPSLTSTVHTLGGFRLTLNGVPVEHWKGGLTKALFQHLLSNLERPVSRTALIEALWGESSATKPAAGLKVAVHTLRQLFTEAPPAGPDDPRLWISFQDAGYALHAENLWIDVHEFEKAVTEAIRLERDGDPAAAAVRYNQAVQLYKGPYLPESDDPWATSRRERFKNMQLQVLTRLAAHSYERGDLQEVLVSQHRMLEIDPCREESYQELMRCHALLHQPSRVQDWFATCVHQMATRLAVEPGAATRAAYHEALRTA